MAALQARSTVNDVEYASAPRLIFILVDSGCIFLNVADLLAIIFVNGIV